MSISRVAAASGFSLDWILKYSDYSGDNLDVAFAAGSGGLTDVFFKPDGMSLYVISTESKVSQYDLTTAWDITTGDFEQSFTVVGDRGLYIRPDGLRMYVRSTGNIRQYELSSAWDISTASLTRTLFLSSDTSPGLWFSSDGSNVFYPAKSGGFIPQWAIRKANLSVPWVIDSSLTPVASYLSGFDTYQSFYFSDDEQYVVATRGSTVSTHQGGVMIASYDASDQDSFFNGVFFRNPRNYYLLGTSTDLIYEYNIA